MHSNEIHRTRPDLGLYQPNIARHNALIHPRRTHTIQPSRPKIQTTFTHAQHHYQIIHKQNIYKNDNTSNNWLLTVLQPHGGPYNQGSSLSHRISGIKPHQRNKPTSHTTARLSGNPPQSHQLLSKYRHAVKSPLRCSIPQRAKSAIAIWVPCLLIQ